MSIFDSMGQLGDRFSSPDAEFGGIAPEYIPETEQFGFNIENAYEGIKTQPTLYNMEGYISPYTSQNWGSNSRLLMELGDEYRLPSVNTIDPNRIFTSDIAALKSLASDQLKILKMFERKLQESLTDKGKFGLTEEDIEAFQAITAGRNAVTSMNNAQIAIKKNIAELKLKQMQNVQKSASSGVDGSVSTGSSAYDIGRSVLDQIFDAPASNIVGGEFQAHVADLDEAADMLDNVVDGGKAVSQYIQYESENPKTVVVVGDGGTDPEYATYSQDGKGELIPDFPTPSVEIDHVDINAKTAYDKNMVKYDIKFRDEQ